MQYSNTRNFIRYCSLAIFSALLSLFIPSTLWFIATGVLSVLGGLFGLTLLLKSPDSRFNFFIVASVVIVLASSLGMLFSYISISLVSLDIWEILLDYAHTTITDVTLAQAYTNAFAIVLLIIGSRKKIQQAGIAIKLGLHTCLRHHKNLVIKLVAFILLCQVYLLGLGVILYGGKDLANEGQPTHPLLSIIQPIAPVVPFVLAFYLTENSRLGFKWSSIIITILLLIELLWFFLFGRRSVLYFFVLFSAGIFYNKVINLKFLFRNFIPIFIFCCAILKIADIYHKMRVVYRFEQAQRMNIVEAIGGLQNVDDDKYSQLRAMNVSARTAYSSLALGQFVNLFRVTNHTPLVGQALYSSILSATPSNFFVDKKIILTKEALYEYAFSVELTDISETLYLESFIDFGLLGIAVYPAFLLLLFLGLYGLINETVNPLFSLVVACVSVHLALMMVEIDMITFLATIRTLFVCYLITLFFRKSIFNQSKKDTVSNENHLPVS